MTQEELIENFYTQFPMLRGYVRPSNIMARSNEWKADWSNGTGGGSGSGSGSNEWVASWSDGTALAVLRYTSYPQTNRSGVTVSLAYPDDPAKRTTMSFSGSTDQAHREIVTSGLLVFLTTYFKTE
jgi:hypothetical protein